MRKIIVALLFVLTCACAHMGAGSGASLEQRAGELRDAWMSQDWGAVYDMTDSAYKESMTKDDFLGRKRNITYLECTLGDISEGNGTEGTVKIHWKFQTFGYTLERTDKQRWVRERGSWFYAMPRDRRFGFDSKLNAQ